MATSESRRSFMGAAFGTVAAVGGIFALGAMKKTWDPLPSVKAAGITTIDLSSMKPGEFRTASWRKKPIFILKKDADMKRDKKRDIIVGGDAYTITIGLCTHLGCIPAWVPSKMIWHCPCHGGEFNASGINIFGPPPKPLVIPPFKVDGMKVILGVKGSQYKKLEVQ